MTDDLQTLQATLKRIVAAKDADAEANRKALVVAMNGVQAALAELLAASEGDDDVRENQATADAAEVIARAIGGIEIPAVDMGPVASAIDNLRMPEIDMAPIVEAISGLRSSGASAGVIAQAIAGIRMPDINLTPQLSLTLDKGKTVMEFTFKHIGPHIVGGTATITRG